MTAAEEFKIENKKVSYTVQGSLTSQSDFWRRNLIPGTIYKTPDLNDRI